MNIISNKLGYWAALLITVTFISWIFLFVAILITSPMFIWTNFSDFLKYYNDNNQLLQNTAKIFMLFFGSLFVILINSFLDISNDNYKALARLSLIFAVSFAILSSLHYFVQISNVRINLNTGNSEGLQNFIQANPTSFSSAMNMLGWTLFLGLSSIFISPFFSGNRLNIIIKIAFIANGISCFIAGFGYLLQIDFITFLFINIGVGGSILTISFSSIKFFKQRIKNI